MDARPLASAVPQNMKHPGPGRWWWLSFCDSFKPEGQQCLGVAVVEGKTLREAIEAFKISLWSAETAEAHVALGEALLQAKDDAGARQEISRALAMEPGSLAARRLMERLGSGPK